MDEEAAEGESLNATFGSRLTALIETCRRISTGTKGAADLQRRCVALLEMQYERPTPAGATLGREWVGVMKTAIATTSAADERMKFWTTKNPWRRFFRFGRSMVKDIEHATKEINHVAGELSLFKQIHASEKQKIGRPLSEKPSRAADRSPRTDPPFGAIHRSRPRYPSAPSPRPRPRPPSMGPSISADRALYEGRETLRRPRVRSLTIQNFDGSNHRRSVVSEGHTSPDEDGESRKRVGYASARSRSATGSLDARDFTQFKVAAERTH